MRIPVLLEPVAGSGYRARGAEPFPLTAEGPTPDQALARLKEMIQANLTLGAQVVSIEVSLPERPAPSHTAFFDPNDPLVQQWKEIIAENRRKAEEDPDVL
ncbi:MAG TPA: hypothetical protein VGY66_26785 [Gemmataceae bacterium]|jgi:hypothetical protein|nr:hypothetical protein [Gemmataceae bacterium]